MAEYRAPLDSLSFTLHTVARLPEILEMTGYREFTPELVDSILKEAAAFAEGTLAPLNVVGDRQGCRLQNGHVTLPQGFPDAYRHFVEGGWNAAPFPAEHGGMGLPVCVSAALQEIWHGANLSFALIPLLTQSAVHVLSAYGDDWQKRHVLPKLVSGQWSGTMCITEPQAGSDVGASRTQAFPQADGTYRIKGSKIFISAGDHDATENIIHLVLARLPDAPSGTKGLSLFLVSKHLLNADGTFAARNDLRPVALEHKMGMHGSSTCVMAFGDEGGAVGTLVGQPNGGIKAMFVMMNAARLGVGLEGLGVAEAATRLARHYAEERVQGRALSSDDATPVPIIHHPDVLRMVRWMESHTQGLRALSAYTAALQDKAHHHADAATRQQAQARIDLLTPVVKAHTTNLAFAIASEGVQVHGGMGFIEETGAAQYLRDVRVTMIYEGTNGIQAQDLAMRKLLLQEGGVMRSLLAEIRIAADRLQQEGDYRLLPLGGELATALNHLEEAAAVMQAQVLHTQSNSKGEAPAGASATAFLSLFGLVMEGYFLAIGAEQAARWLDDGDSRYDSAFLSRQMALARFFLMDTLLDSQTLKERVRLAPAALDDRSLS